MVVPLWAFLSLLFQSPSPIVVQNLFIDGNGKETNSNVELGIVGPHRRHENDEVGVLTEGGILLSHQGGSGSRNPGGWLRVENEADEPLGACVTRWGTRGWATAGDVWEGSQGGKHEGKRVRRTSFITVVQPREAESQNVDGKSQPALP
ncbi:hypothetical protein CPB85DRAFT_1256322 [Mucidula mucida]|nr:hypothetical protein CPB85DRAFT_1256322 [Mucidula mucida]